MGLFLLSALTPALIPFAVDKTAILHRSDMRRGRCFGSVFCSGSQHICFGEKGEASDRTGRKTETSVSDLLFSNTPAIAADAVMIVSIAATIYCALHIEVNDFWQLRRWYLRLQGFMHIFCLTETCISIYGTAGTDRGRDRQKNGKTKKNRKG